MMRLDFNQLLVTGVSFAAVSLTLPFPLVSTLQDTAEPPDKQAVVQRAPSIDYTETEQPQKKAGSEEQPQEALGHIIMPLTKSQAGDLDEGLVVALSQPISATSQTVSEEKIVEVKEKKSEPETAFEAELQPSFFVKPVLSMPGSITTQKEENTEGDRPIKNVAPSLLVTTERSEDESKKAPETAEAVVEEIEAPPAPEPVVGVAERVQVPSIAIDIAVRPGVYDPATGSWTVDDISAFHASTTVPVNDTNGTTLIYGHAKWGIFGNLPDVQPGAEAIVYAADGLQFIYTFESVRQVDPADLSMLTIEGEPRLLLQTCSGLLDQHRTLAAFRLKEVVHA